jgi:FkbM family methyltransferase
MRSRAGTPFDGVADIEDVISAYRLLLGRNPDPAGLDHFGSMIARGLTVDQLCQMFVDSDEFRSRHEDKDAVVEVDCGGYVVFVRRGERDFGWKIEKWKTWEPHIVRTLTGALREGATLVDIGANVGVMAFAGAKAVGPTGTVIAVEPNHENLQRLYAGTLRNAFGNVRVLPFAASDRAGIHSLEGGTSNTYVTAAAQGKEFIQSVALDEELGDLPSLDLVKIDIEGHEPRAIAGFARTLRRHRPVMLMEFNPRCLRDVAGLDPRECLGSFFDLLEDVRIVEYSGDLTPMASAAAMWQCWEERNREAARTGILPEGMLHFDVLGRVR